jgi:uncharacterized repeat protein (TIGR03803 family)
MLNGSYLYGMTGNGGLYDDGTVFRIPVTGGTPTTLLSLGAILPFGQNAARNREFLAPDRFS